MRKLKGIEFNTIDKGGRNISESEITNKKIKYLHSLLSEGKTREAMQWTLNNNFHFVATVFDSEKRETEDGMTGMDGTIIYDGFQFTRSEMATMSKVMLEVVESCMERTSKDDEPEDMSFLEKIINADGLEEFKKVMYEQLKKEFEGDKNANNNHKQEMGEK